MSVVWAAFDRLLGRDVALKLLRPDRSPDEGRLMQEFALLSSLDHPGIVTVRDVGLAGDTLYLATDLVGGVTLDRWLATSPSQADCVGVATDLLATVGWLHRQGVIHADMKPANILVEQTEHGCWPTIIDFGLDKHLHKRRKI